MGGSAGAEGILATRQSNKRRHSTMEESHGSSSPAGLPDTTTSHDSLYDSHYNNEQPTRRPRLEPPQRLPFGYGFDYRRPVFTTTEHRTRSPSLFDMNDQLETIDLTRDTLALPRLPRTTATNPSSSTQHSPQRATGLPRFSREDIIDISSGEEDEEDSEPRIRYPRTESSRSELDDTFQGSDSLDSLGDTELYTFAELVEDDDNNDNNDDDLFVPNFSSQAATPSAEQASRGMSRRIRSQQSSIPSNAHVVDLTDDDVEFIESRSRPGANIHEPTFSRGVQTRQGDRAAIIASTYNRITDAFRTSLGHAHRLIPRIAHHYHDMEQLRLRSAARPYYPERQFNGSLTAAMNALHNAVPVGSSPGAASTSQNLPGQMDYTWTAFDLGHPVDQRDRPAQYEAPPPLPEGFTGSPTVDEPVVCPNCGDELAQGDTELQRQVWIIKACGHAYCGNCVDAKLQHVQRKRSARRDKTSEQTTLEHPLLRNCVVEGCGKPVSKSTVLHVYLSE